MECYLTCHFNLQIKVHIESVFHVAKVLMLLAGQECFPLWMTSVGFLFFLAARRGRSAPVYSSKGIPATGSLQHIIEVLALCWGGCTLCFSPSLQVSRQTGLVPGFKAPFCIAVLLQSLVALTQYSLSHASQLHVCCLESFCFFTVQWFFFAIDHDGATSL